MSSIKPDGVVRKLRPLTNDEQKLRGIIEELCKEFERMESDLLVKVFERVTGEKITPETMKEKASRIELLFNVETQTDYQIKIDGKKVGRVQRDYMKGVITFYPDELYNLNIN